MNSLQIISLLLNSVISVGSSVVLLYVDIGIHTDIKELNVFLASIFSTVNLYTIYSSFICDASKCDELGYSKDYKAVNEETLREDEVSQDFHNIFNESNMITVDSLYYKEVDDELYEDLYEEKI
jgi:hypothetical protein